MPNPMLNSVGYPVPPQQVEAIQLVVYEMVRLGYINTGGGGGGLPVQVDFSTAVPLDANKFSTDYNMTGAFTFTVASGPVEGGSYYVTMIGDGNNGHVPDFGAITVLDGGTDFNTAAGRINLVTFGYMNGRSYVIVNDTGNIVVSLPVFSAQNAPDGNENLDYTYTFVAGPGSMTYTLASGTLPPGLALNSGTGTLSGAPTDPGDYTFTIAATNITGSTNSTPQTVHIEAAATASLAISILPANPIDFDDYPGLLDWIVQTGSGSLPEMRARRALDEGSILIQPAELINAVDSNVVAFYNPATWTDGTPDASGSADNGRFYALSTAAAGGLRIPVKVLPLARQIIMYVAGMTDHSNTQLIIKATLEDASAVVAPLVLDPGATGGGFNYTLIVIDVIAGSNTILNVDIQSSPLVDTGSGFSWLMIHDPEA